MQETNNSNSSFNPFLIVLNIFTYIGYGIKAVFYDFFRNLFAGASYTVDQTYRSGLAAAAKSDEEKLYDLTKKKTKVKKIPKYSQKYLAQLEQKKQALLVDLQTAGATRSKVPHVYYYVVKDSTGLISHGTMNGLSKLDINSYLLNEGYEVYDIKTSAFIDFAFKESSFMGKGMSVKDLIFWLTQLSTYLKAGLTLNNSVRILSEQMKGNKSRKTALKAISYELTLGESFSTALEKQGNMFPPLLINMIKAAEATGTLQETLDDMANYYTEVNETRKQMVSAMTYPAIITVFSFGVIIFILAYVVPRFVDIYSQNDVAIEGLTKVVIDVSAFLKDNYLTLFAIIAGIIIFLIIAYKTVKAFKASFQIFLMHIPVIKDIIIYNEMAIFSKTFASLLNNNVFITDSMDILSKITNNEVYKSILYKTINNIVKGDKISEAFKDHWAIPDVAYYMIVTGEETGELGQMMQKVSEYYQMMHRSIINNLKSFIEPIMISFLAIVVGGIIVAVIVPMFGMYSKIQ